MPKVRDAITLIQWDDWRLVRVRGSHRQYKHPFKAGRVTIPGHPNDDLASRNVDQYFETGRIDEE